MSSSNCCCLTCIQISQQADQVVWYSHLLQNFPQFIVIHTVKGFGIVNKAEIDVFLEISCFFHDPADVDNLISGSSAFSKTSLNIWKFTVHILLKPGLENFEHYFTSVWDECNCAVVWAFFGIAFFGYWNENWAFVSLYQLPTIHPCSFKVIKYLQELAIHATSLPFKHPFCKLSLEFILRKQAGNTAYYFLSMCGLRVDADWLTTVVCIFLFTYWFTKSYQQSYDLCN